MKYLVLLVVFGVSHSAILPFTPEVAAERERFIKIFNAAAAAAGGPQLALATPVAATGGQPGQVPDTPEVEAAKRAFLDAYETQLQAVGARIVPVVALAPVEVAPSPVVSVPIPSDDVEVAAARAEFFRTYNEVLIRLGHAPLPFGETVLPSPRWTGPFAATIPAGLPGSGPVGDTAEVAAAKADFLRAYQAAITNLGPVRRI